VPKLVALAVTLYGPSGSRSARKTTLGIADRGAGEICAEVGYGDLGACQWAPRWVVHDPLNISGVGLGLGEYQTLGDREGRQEGNQHEPVVTHEKCSPFD
jgi:hypothetical protein